MRERTAICAGSGEADRRRPRASAIRAVPREEWGVMRSLYVK
jgi:hypothetical protein